MAAGRPFICTASPDSPLDRLRDESDAFIACPPHDSAKLLDALETLLHNPEERARLGANGRVYVERNAGRTACADAYRAAFLELR
jgi:colanic acid biosynthesis glycosyl transferase WcaI